MSEDSENFFGGIIGLIGIVAFILMVLLGIGWIGDVVMGKMTTGQYIKKIQSE